MSAPLVIIVDDDAASGRRLSMLLRAAGFSALSLVTGEGCLTAITHGLMPSVIAVDLMLPHMDGNELITKLRAMTQAKLIVTTGWKAMLRPEVEAKVDAVVEKPIDGTELLTAIRNALGNSEGG